MKRRTRKLPEQQQQSEEPLNHNDNITQDLLATPINSFRTNLRLKKVEMDEKKQFSGKHANVVLGQRNLAQLEEIMMTPTRQNCSQTDFLTPHCAIKTQRISNPRNLNDRSYRELLILQELATLHKMRKCSNFVRIYDWFKSGNNDCNTGTPQQINLQFMNYVLEKGDDTLHNLLLKNKNTITLSMYKTILFQILYALQCAHRFQFMHNDLHAKNILIKSLPDNVQGCCFHCDFTFYQTNERILVKITDFGLSQIKTAQGVMIDNTATGGDLFNPFKDAEQIAREFSRVKIAWESEAVKLEEQPKLRSLRRKMQKCQETPNELLDHEFFESLQFQPEFDEEGHISPLKGKKMWYYGDLVPKNVRQKYAVGNTSEAEPLTPVCKRKLDDDMDVSSAAKRQKNPQSTIRE